MVETLQASIDSLLLLSLGLEMAVGEAGECLILAVVVVERDGDSRRGIVGEALL